MVVKTSVVRGPSPPDERVVIQRVGDGHDGAKDVGQPRPRVIRHRREGQPVRCGQIRDQSRLPPGAGQRAQPPARSAARGCERSSTSPAGHRGSPPPPPRLPQIGAGSCPPPAQRRECARRRQSAQARSCPISRRPSLTGAARLLRQRRERRGIVDPLRHYIPSAVTRSSASKAPPSSASRPAPHSRDRRHRPPARHGAASSG